MAPAPPLPLEAPEPEGLPPLPFEGPVPPEPDRPPAEPEVPPEPPEVPPLPPGKAKHVSLALTTVVHRPSETLTVNVCGPPLAQRYEAATPSGR